MNTDTAKPAGRLLCDHLDCPEVALTETGRGDFCAKHKPTAPLEYDRTNDKGEHLLLLEPCPAPGCPDDGWVRVTGSLLECCHCGKRVPVKVCASCERPYPAEYGQRHDTCSDLCLARLLGIDEYDDTDTCSSTSDDDGPEIEEADDE